MPHYGIVPLRFGSAAPELVNNSFLAFYDWIIRELLPKDHLSLHPEQKKTPLSLPLTLKESQSRGYAAYGKIQDFVEPWITEVSYVVVDLLDHLSGVRPGRIDDSVGSAINTLLSCHDNLQKVILLLKTLPAENSALFKILAPQVGSKIVVVSELGKTLGIQASLPFSDEFQKQYQESTPDAVTRFAQKLIRRRGHFQPTGSDCVNTIFDSSAASHELADLLSDLVSAEVSDPSVSAMFYHSVFSQWLDEPVRAASTRLEIPGYKLLETSEIGTLIPTGCHNAVIVVPLIETGNTLRSIITSLRNSGYVGAITAMSVLSTLGEEKHFGSTELSIGDEVITVRYILQVDSRRDNGPCIQCQLSLPISSIDDEHDLLDTLQFWQMAAIWREEPASQRPTGRQSAGYLPDFKEMVAANGSWLASKLKRLIDLASIDPDALANPFLVVCPDEEGARTLALYFGLLQGFTVVRIPRSDLNAVPDPGDATANDWLQNKVWAQQIRKSALGGPVVLLEEFTVSGGTRQSLERAVNLCGKTPKYHVSIAEFGPSKSESSNDRLMSLALYSCPIQ